MHCLHPERPADKGPIPPACVFRPVSQKEAGSQKWSLDVAEQASSSLSLKAFSRLSHQNVWVLQLSGNSGQRAGDSQASILGSSFPGARDELHPPPKFLC